VDCLACAARIPRNGSFDQIAVERAIIDARDTIPRLSVNARGILKKIDRYDHFIDLRFFIWTQVLKNLRPARFVEGRMEPRPDMECRTVGFMAAEPYIC
jgi:hypothetical protein